VGFLDKLKEGKQQSDQAKADKKAAKADKKKPAKKPAAKKAPKQQNKKKGGFLSRVGATKVEEPTKEDKDRQARHEIIKQTWQFVRTTTDAGVQQYFESGSTEKLDKIMSPEIRGKIVKELDQIKAAGATLNFDDRNVKSNTQVEIVDEKLVQQKSEPGEPPRKPIPREFTIVEHFSDYTQLVTPEGTRDAQGTQRSIQATVQVLQNGVYHIIAINKSDQGI
jgi:hypothetical protein